MVLFVAIPAAAIIVILRGWILKIMWGWFMTPIFHIPQITTVQAIGIAVVIGFLTEQPHKSQKIPESNKERLRMIGKAFLSGIIYASFSLIMGWVAHFFM